MNDPADSKAQAAGLEQLLSPDEVHPINLEAGLKKYGDAARNTLAARLAGTLYPLPGGFLIARLKFILTDKNKPDLERVYIMSLKSPDARARGAALEGLDELHHPDAEAFARLSLRDGSDMVLASACHILIPKSKVDPQLRDLLRQLYDLHKGQEDFYQSQSALVAGGIGPTP